MNKPKPTQGLFLAIMKVSLTQMLIMALLTSLVYCAELKGQEILERKITLDLQHKEIKFILSSIEKQASVRFTYNPISIHAEKKISIRVNERRLEDVLQQIFGPGLTYELVGTEIVLKDVVVDKDSVEASGAIASVAVYAAIQVRGKVTDASGEPLPGVNVVEKGTTNGTATDAEGRYSLTVVEPNAVLVFSFIGYESKEIPVNARNTIDVSLTEDATTLDEVVVVAFGEQKKSEVVGSMTTIKPSELKVPSSNLTTALAGRLSGVIAYQRSGEPGEDNADFFIRGVTTFGYKKDPLILIDGIESTATDLARLQTDDVESFSIMKDATATAVYGSRAANGVILIKTKEGKEGKASISLRFENSLSIPTRDVELADPVTYMRLHNEAVLTRDPLGILPYSPQKIEHTVANTNRYMYPTTDWRKALIRDYTMNQRANLNVSGGGQVARYYVAGAINQENGLLKVDRRNNFNNNVDLKSYSLRSNVNINLTKITELAFRISGNFDDYTGPTEGGTQVYRNIMRTNPVLFPAYYPIDADHQYLQHTMFGNYDDGSGRYYLNPYAELVKGYKDYSKSVMSAQFEIKQNLSFLTEGLNIQALLSTTRNTYFDVSRSYQPFWYQATTYDKFQDTYKLMLLNEENGTEYLGYAPGRKDVQSSFYMQSVLNYNRTFNKRHAVNGLFVFLVQNTLTGNAGDLQSSLPFRNVGLAGRTSYSFNNRYSAEFNFGYNASERFYRNYRWGFFPSAGVAWTVSNEAFWAPLEDKINNFKLRATYGLTGNDAIGSANDRFLYLSNVNMNDAARGAVFGRDNGYSRSGMSISRYSDPTISWETATKSNLGLELGLLHRVKIEADFYKEIRSNILQSRVAIPAEMGLSAAPKANIGKAEGKGVDLSLDYNHWIGNSLWLQGRANFTYATSKFLVYEEYNYKQEPWKSHVGYSINQQWGYLAERLFVDDKEAAKAPLQNFGEYGGGDIKYHDVNGDRQITALDQVPLGHPTVPEIVYGFGFSMGYKNIDFSCFFQGLGRESFWINAEATAPFVEYYYPGETLPGKPQNQLLKAYADDHWSEEDQNLNALWPRLSATAAGNNNNSQRSTWFMRNGAFLRLKQVELGYTIPQQTLQKLHMKTLRLYLNSTNPLIWSSFDLWDVEMGGNGLGYPIQKVFNAGMLMTF